MGNTGQFPGIREFLDIEQVIIDSTLPISRLQIL